LPAEAKIFRGLLDSLSIGVAYVTIDGAVLYANDYFGQLIAGSDANLTGRALKEHISGDNWTLLDLALQQAQKTSVEGEMRITSAAGKRTVRLSFTALAGMDSTAIRIAATEVTQLVETKKALKQTEASLHAASVQLVRIQDDERRNMARDLHDVTGQELAVVLMSLDRLTRELGSKGDDVRQRMEECVGWIRKIESEIRTLSYVLHPPMLDEMGLGAALGVFTQGFGKRTGIDVSLKVMKDLPRLKTEIEIAVFRVIQESLTNIFRHSGSTRAWVEVGFKEKALRAAIRDEGKGIVEQREKRKSGVGMQSMRGRLQLLGGALHVKSSSGGTEIRADLPVSDQDILTYGGMLPDGEEHGHAGTKKRRNARSRLLIVDDHEVARQGLRALLKGESDLEICGEAENGNEAVEKAKKLLPDLIIMDLSMPEAGGFSAANRIRGAGIASRILIYTTHAHSALEKTARATGCHGLVLKSNAAKDLLRGVRAVLRGGEFYGAVTATAALEPA